ncbi:UPF0187-domain-containing protein [Coprinellus micaceus]|uniref:UPF0187-domain-containing protein n=1 Tax=Coprinellus micaceus TaxID=71717 RepID=A0A4Y7TEW7_COPMI|nr:UPF0187-domain-containing protein [Coprinellus micaceus]
MVATNPLFQGTWTLRRLNSMILSDIWPEMIFFSAVATAVAIVTDKTDADLAIGNQLLTVGGVILGLVISFRTSSAYERYQDGSKMWTNIGTASRNLAQQIWIHVPDERQLPDSDPTPVLNVIIEKKTMINMIHAFAVSVKHLLRDEPGVFYEDLYPSVAFLPKYATGTRRAADILPVWHVQAGRRLTPAALKRRDTLLGLVESPVPPLKPATLPPHKTIYDYLPILRLPRWTMKKAVEKAHLLSKEDDDEDIRQLRPKKKRIAYSDVVESTVPLEIYLYLSNYTAFLMKNNLLQPAVATAMTNALLALHDSLAQLERICNNPLPFAYYAHLRMTVWLYLLFFPFQIIELFEYYTIPATCLVTFLLCGFMELGQEIENPFNYDLNDLDLDRYCNAIKRELLEITTQPNAEPSSFLYTSQNQPFAPHDRRTADVLRADKPEAGEYISPGNASLRDIDGLRHTMVRNWVEVQRLTRKSAK